MADLTTASKTGVNFWARVQIFTLPKHNFRVERPLDLWRVIWLLGAQKCAHNTLPFQTQQNMGVELTGQRIPLNSCANTWIAPFIFAANGTPEFYNSPHIFDNLVTKCPIYWKCTSWQCDVSEAKRRASRMEESPPGLLRLVNHVFTISPKNHLHVFSSYGFFQGLLYNQSEV